MAARRGFVIAEDVRDEGVNGANAERPGLRRLRELHDQKRIDGVIVDRIDFLADPNGTARSTRPPGRGFFGGRDG